MPFKERIKEIRKELGLKQKEMAENYNISLSTLQRYEKGSMFPGGPFLIELALRGYNLHWLLTGDGDKYKFKSPAIDPDIREIWAWLNEISEKDKGYKDWFRIEFKKKFPEFAEWKRKVDSERKASLAQQQKIA